MFLNATRPVAAPYKPAIADFYLKRIVEDDTWNNVHNGEVSYYLFRENDRDALSLCRFRVETGQIGLFYIWDDKIRGKGLGKQILSKAIGEIIEHGTADTVWAVTTDDHPFWSNVWYKSFKPRDPVHRSVTGSGYSMSLDHYKSKFKNTNKNE